MKSIFNMLFCEGYPKEEYKQLYQIRSSEYKFLRKRPAYIIGNIFIIGLCFYFLVKAAGPETLQWPRMRDIIITAISTFIMAVILWAMLRAMFVNMYKVSGEPAKFAAISWFLWMFVFGLIMRAGPESVTKWEYMIYAMIIVIGWGCIRNSMCNYFCRKTLRNQTEQSAQTDNSAEKQYNNI